MYLFLYVNRITYVFIYSQISIVNLNTPLFSKNTNCPYIIVFRNQYKLIKIRIPSQRFKTDYGGPWYSRYKTYGITVVHYFVYFSLLWCSKVYFAQLNHWRVVPSHRVNWQKHFWVLSMSSIWVIRYTSWPYKVILNKVLTRLIYI